MAKLTSSVTVVLTLKYGLKFLGLFFGILSFKKGKIVEFFDGTFLNLF